MRRITETVALLVLAGAAGWAADLKAGKIAYDQACKSCHGADGTPSAAVAKMMKVEMKDLKSSEVPAEAMAKIVTEGKGKMMPVKSVTGPAVDNVVAYVKSLKK